MVMIMVMMMMVVMMMVVMMVVTMMIRRRRMMMMTMMMIENQTSGSALRVGLVVDLCILDKRDTHHYSSILPRPHACIPGHKAPYC